MSDTFERSQFPLVHRLRVRWAEVDAQQVVFNGHYLTYLDVAISEYWRAVGLPYPDGMSHLGGDIYVRQHQLSYNAPARLDDWLDIGVRCHKIGTSSITIDWAVWGDHRLLVAGQAVYVHVSLDTGRSAPVPEAFRRQVQAHASGLPVTELTVGSWAQQEADARAVRWPVFVQEQAVPEHEEWDADDAHACHVVVRNLGGLPLATGRLITHGQPEGQARLGRMAVIKAMRGAGAGRQVLAALLAEALRRGVRQVHIHAQCSAEAFYRRSGFVREGEVFDEVGIPHVGMVWSA
jgi:YbgC/YbaW family acyl-CoA thioester hydrolase